MSPVRRPKRRIWLGRDVDVVRARQVVRIGRAQEAEAVLQNLDDACADDLDLPGRELLQDGEHQLLLAHGARVLDLDLLGEGDEFGRRLGLEVLKFDFPHRGTLSELGGVAAQGPGRARKEGGWFDRAAPSSRCESGSAERPTQRNLSLGRDLRCNGFRRNPQVPHGKLLQIAVGCRSPTIIAKIYRNTESRKSEDS